MAFCEYTKSDEASEEKEMRNEKTAKRPFLLGRCRFALNKTYGNRINEKNNR